MKEPESSAEPEGRRLGWIRGGLEPGGEAAGVPTRRSALGRLVGKAM